MLIIENKEQFEKAIEDKENEFFVIGELVEDIKKTQVLTTVSKWTLALLVLSLAAIPFTGGTSSAATSSLVAANYARFVASAAGAGTVAPITVAIYAAIAVIGISVLIAFYRHYDTVEVEIDVGGVIKSGMKCSRKT